jgi:hypothetical protein
MSNPTIALEGGYFECQRLVPTPPASLEIAHNDVILLPAGAASSTFTTTSSGNSSELGR